MTARLLGTAARFNSRNQRLSDAASHPGRRKAFRPGLPPTPAAACQSLTKVSDQPESRMRQTRLSGLEGGEPQTNAASLPLSYSSSTLDFFASKIIRITC